ncbi:uncharacterized protein LOC108917905 [Anoplophora glabripennis]|uniref:uncharacterized protein LOC108917905 n=1 Tax=Anoplophora glabripennis TaxID=217634 RepID=UPI0008746AB4|nr:uncharacterized protein LOC108917905 [Anoplophora glabripennis]XP_023310461.1 uncharacterized protein LOC108917905 [Anoplophora glabripennis]
MNSEIKQIDKILLPKYLGSEGEITKCHVKRLTAAGENYGSLMLAIDVTIRNEDSGKERVLHIVGKAVPPNEFIQKMFKSPLTFKKELEFYRIIVPTLQEFQRENGIEKVMDFFPEFYGGRMGMNPHSDEFDDNAVILLENLKMKGYYCVDRTIGFDLNAAKYILKNLAILHGVPLALKLKRPEEFQKKILPHIHTIKLFDGLGDDILNAMIDSFISIAKENEECLPFIPNMKKKLLESFNLLENPIQPREPFSTLIHLDFWVNNTMVRTEEGKVVGNKIVDFQIPEYGSPARDLTFFIFDSIQNEVIVKHYNHLIEFYHQNLIDTLKQFDVNTKSFSLEAFKDEIDLAMKEFVRLQCFIMLKPIFATQDTVKEVEDMSLNDLKENNVIAQPQKEKLWMLVKEFGKRGWL